MMCYKIKEHNIILRSIYFLKVLLRQTIPGCLADIIQNKMVLLYQSAEMIFWVLRVIPANFIKFPIVTRKSEFPTPNYTPNYTHLQT